MLVQFTTANFRSFNEPQTLSLVAANSLKRLRDENTFEPKQDGIPLPQLLRCAAIFGPNSAGKSNLIRALQFLEQMVMGSASAKPEQPIAVEPYRLSSGPANGDSQFEIEFIEREVRYQFGLQVNKERITGEWLIAYYTTRPTELYRRVYQDTTKSDLEEGLIGSDEYSFGRSFKGGRLRRDWAAQTGPKTLYLSRVVQASSEEFQQLRIPYQWFARRLRIQEKTSRNGSHSYTARYCETEEGKSKVLEFLRGFDIPIHGLRFRKSRLDLDEAASMFTPAFLQKLKPTQDRLEPIFTHLNRDGEEIEFGVDNESEGTLNLFAFAAKWIDVLENDYVLIVDELDSSLHPLAVWELIRKLTESKSQAQLIFTTHDVTVLKSKLLRRDQVFFVAQNNRHESNVYSLFDFNGREEDAFEDRYLQGRYGATPVITK